ncbi:H-2 class II histocompatibility antigen, A-U alpha chain-like [Sardina pilchardus]|uniref:H-2 class II histocompatibility antigen, A-U alpha chain-like n=1 Tax=Sardina pilchardus TaxID=27697 RepID=UPI002E1076F1
MSFHFCSKMKNYVLLSVVFQFSAMAQIHEFVFYNVCFETEGTSGVIFDGEEVMFINDKEPVYTFPSFINTSALVLPPYTDNGNRSQCRSKIVTLIDEEVNITETEDPPESTVYTRDCVEFGVKNTLICFVNHFHPPVITVRWTKNNVEITEGVNQSRYYGHADGKFHVFSTLNFMPEESDIYGCTVEHQALEKPNTKIWVVPVQEWDVGPSVLCGVGIGLGLLGMISGTFLLKKGLNQACDHLSNSE